MGYTAGPENCGYLIRVHVSDNEEKALKNARQFMWMQGEFTGLAHPVWANPSGYFSPSGRRNFVEFAVGRAKNPRGSPSFEEQLASTMIIAGTPDTVIPRLKTLIEQTRPGIMGLWANDGTVSAGGHPHLHPAAVPGGDAGHPRARQVAGAEQPIRGRRAGEHRLFARLAAGRGGVAATARAAGEKKSYETNQPPSIAWGWRRPAGAAVLPVARAGAAIQAADVKPPSYPIEKGATLHVPPATRLRSGTDCCDTRECRRFYDFCDSSFGYECNTRCLHERHLSGRQIVDASHDL